MRHVIGIGTPVFLFSGLVLAQEPAGKPGQLTDPVEILKKADEVCKPVKSFQYKAAAEGLGSEEGRRPKTKATLLTAPGAEKAPPTYKIEAEVTAAGSSDVQKLTSGCDGSDFYVIDYKNKKVYQDVDPAVVGSFRRMLGGLRMGEFGHERPFGDEMEGEVKELKGIEKVGNEECYHIYVKYKGMPLEADWYFSTKDFLPRRADRMNTNPETGEKGGGRLVVTDLVINPKTDAKSFAIVIPEGFEKIEDFAP